MDALTTVLHVLEEVRRLPDGTALAAATCQHLRAALDLRWAAIVIDHIEQQTLHAAGDAPRALDAARVMEVPLGHTPSHAPEVGDADVLLWLREQGIAVSYVATMAGRDCLIGRLLIGPPRIGPALSCEQAQCVAAVARIVGIALVHRLEQSMAERRSARQHAVELHLEALTGQLEVTQGRLRWLTALALQHPGATASELFAALGSEQRECGRDVSAAPHAAPGPISADTRPRPGPPIGLMFTERQIDVVRLLVEGRRDSEIASALIIGVDAVRHHTRTIFQRLDVHSRGAAIAELFRRGVMPTHPGETSRPLPRQDYKKR